MLGPNWPQEGSLTLASDRLALVRDVVGVNSPHKNPFNASVQRRSLCFHVRIDIRSQPSMTAFCREDK